MKEFFIGLLVGIVLTLVTVWYFAIGRNRTDIRHAQDATAATVQRAATATAIEATDTAITTKLKAKFLAENPLPAPASPLSPTMAASPLPAPLPTPTRSPKSPPSPATPPASATSPPICRCENEVGENMRKNRVAWQRRWNEWQWPVLGGLTLLSLWLGCVGFWEHAAAHGETISLLDAFYLSIQLFVLQSGSVKVPVGWELEVARLLAPAIAAYAAARTLAVILHEQFQSLRLRLLDRHVVICGLGAKGTQLALDCRQEGERVVVIEQNETSDGIARCRQTGALVLPGDATHESVLVQAGAGRASLVMVTCGADAANIQVALNLQRVVHRSSTGLIRCYLHLVNSELQDLLRHHKLLTTHRDRLEVNLFNDFENAARSLWMQHPLDWMPIAQADATVVRLVIIGFGQMGEAIALQAARTGHYANGRKIRLTIIDREAARRQRAFTARYPRLDQVCETEFLELDAAEPATLSQIAQRCAEPHCLSTVAVCLDNDATSLSIALKLIPTLGNQPVQVLARMNEEKGLAALLRDGQGGRLHAFGMASQSCTRDMLLHEQQDRFAKEIHRIFVERAVLEGRDVATDPALQPWPNLDETYRDSNRQQADHIPVKLRAVGCFSAPPQPGQPAVTEFTEAEIELLARMEHARWCAERWLDGWTLGPKDRSRKITPDLVPWEELTDGVKEYDRQAVRNIPRLLELIGEKVYRQKE